MAGVDEVTWKSYGEGLEDNPRDLTGRLRRGAYRASPVRRAYITKANGGQRPLGVPTLEDKFVQRATVDLMNAIYEQDFVGFSYGFRPGRNQHQALDALAVGLREKNVKWVLDADIQGFFDTLDHGWLMKFVEHRIGDRRIIRLLRKWLKAGVLEEGELVYPEAGTVQGGSISPLLANIYLHYVLDRWAHRWRRTQSHGEMSIVRYADAFVVGFEYREDGERFLIDLRDRLAVFALELHPDKTRLLELGRFAIANRRRRGQGKPETFEFLGFTHICGHSRRGRAMLLRKTSRKKFQAKLQEIHRTLRRNLNRSIPQMGKYLRAVLRGHVAYYGVPTNGKAIAAFRYALGLIWKRVLERRSERTRVRWERIRQLIDRWLPPARVCHLIRPCASSPGPKAGARCGSAARRDLYRGPGVTRVPTALGSLTIGAAVYLWQAHHRHESASAVSPRRCTEVFSAFSEGLGQPRRKVRLSQALAEECEQRLGVDRLVPGRLEILDYMMRTCDLPADIVAYHWV